MPAVHSWVDACCTVAAECNKLKKDGGRPEKAAMLVRSEAVLNGVVAGAGAERLKADEGTARA